MGQIQPGYIYTAALFNFLQLCRCVMIYIFLFWEGVFILAICDSVGVVDLVFCFCFWEAG